MARILVLDDDVNIVKLVETVLSANGHDVIGTVHPHEAFEAVRKAPFDLIVLDLLMPEFSGVDFMNSLRILFGFQAPVLILSGQSSIEEVRRTLALGATDYLVKPFDPAVLLARIDGVMKKKFAAKPPGG